MPLAKPPTETHLGLGWPQWPAEVDLFIAGVARLVDDFHRAIDAELDPLTLAAEQPTGFDGWALVVWPSRDRVVPPDRSRQLAALLPHEMYPKIDDGDLLFPHDQSGPLGRFGPTFAGSR